MKCLVYIIIEGVSVSMCVYDPHHLKRGISQEGLNSCLVREKSCYNSFVTLVGTLGEESHEKIRVQSDEGGQLQLLLELTNWCRWGMNMVRGHSMMCVCACF